AGLRAFTTEWFESTMRLAGLTPHRRTVESSGLVVLGVSPLPIPISSRFSIERRKYPNSHAMTLSLLLLSPTEEFRVAATAACAFLMLIQHVGSFPLQSYNWPQTQNRR